MKEELLSTKQRLESEKSWRSRNKRMRRAEEERQRPAAKRARENARKGSQKSSQGEGGNRSAIRMSESRTVIHSAALSPAERKTMELMRRYPWAHLSEVHFAALNAERDEGAKY